MYRLTPRMEQELERNLQNYHELFHGRRCSGDQLEEFIFKAIQLDETAGHHASWQAGGHDKEADIRVVVDNEEHLLQIKSGSVKGGYLTLSGHRLGSFDGNLQEITEYLNNLKSEILSVPYRQVNDDTGRHHIYQIIYVDDVYLRGLDSSGWVKSGTRFEQENPYGVIFSLNPTMSWQIWWKIPEQLLTRSPEFIIG